MSEISPLTEIKYTEGKKIQVPEFDNSTVETILTLLDRNSYLFPQFALLKINNKLQLLGSGGFSSVYEMYDKERPEIRFALKVIGFSQYTISSNEFWSTGRIQWVLCQDSKFIMRILDARELLVFFDDNGEIRDVRDATKDSWEEDKKCIRLQFVLMEKLSEILTKDRFQNVSLNRKELDKKSEVLTFALEIGQGLCTAHNNRCLHRDIKLENIFWDEQEQVYKLGDFGIAKYAEDGNAETIVYTKGYGAPEIERRLYDYYNATADIYSFGITLYLLLNDLKFPGSDGYYSKVEVQYNPDFVFPAPAHASEEMTRIIRKMCSFRAEDRYQSMAEVLMELTMVGKAEGIDTSDDLLELADMATETYREENSEPADLKEDEERPKTRAERKEEQKIADILYWEDCTIYLIALTLLITLLYKGMQPDSSMVMNRMFFVLPIAVMFEALLQRMKELHLFLGAIIVAFAGFSIYSIGFTFPHLILILCVLIGCPILTMAGALSTGLWMLLEITSKLEFLNFLWKYDLGWILLIMVFFVVNRYFHMRIYWEKTTYIRAFLGIYFYDKIFVVMILSGIVLFILQKCNVLVLPEIVNRMHFIRTGIISFIVMTFLTWWDGYLNDITEDENQIGVETLDNDEHMDERRH